MLLIQARSMLVPALVAAGVVTGGAALTARLSGAQFYDPRSGLPPPGQAKATVPPEGTKVAIPPGRTTEKKAAANDAVPGSGPAPARAEIPDGGGGDFGGFSLEEAERLTIARLAAKIATTDKNPRSQALQKKLDELVTLHFPDDTPLENVLKRIKEASRSTDGKPIPVYVDPQGLADVDKTLASSVVIDLEDVPLRFSLRLALKQLGLAYCVRDGVLIISSVEGIQQELMEAMAEQAVLYPKEYPMMPGGYGGMGGMGGYGEMMRRMGGRQ